MTKVQVGGVSHLSPFDAARHWRHGHSDQGQPPGAGASATGGRHEPSAAHAPRAVNLTIISSQELEKHLNGLFGRRGYTVWPMPARGEIASSLLICRADQGVVVQVKRWNGALGPEVVRAIVAGVSHHTATLARLGCSQIGGMIVSTSQFAPEARDLAARSGVLLWDRQELESQLLADLAAISAAEARQAARGARTPRS